MSKCRHQWVDPHGYGSGTVPPDCRRSARNELCETMGAHVSTKCARCGAMRVICPTGGTRITEQEEE